MHSFARQIQVHIVGIACKPPRALFNVHCIDRRCVRLFLPQGVLKRTVEGLKNRKQQVAPQDDNRLFRVW